MAKSYNVQEVRQRLAKHIEGMIDRVAGDIQDLVKREDIKKSLWATAHEEPGIHSPEVPGEQPHMEPGGDEQFALNPPATPEAATAAPIHGGNGVPPGQLDNPATPGADAGGDPMCSMIMGDGPCPLCAQPEQNCKCLDQMILGKSLVKNASMGYGAGPAAGGAPLAMNEMCKACGKGHGMEKCGASMPATDPAKKSETDGRNGNPTKKQPTAPVDGAKMPPESPKKVKGPDDAKVKENGLNKGYRDTSAPVPPAIDSEPEPKCEVCGTTKGASSGICDSCYEKKYGKGVKKTDVPQAKPPSGKVPGGTSNPPMASTSSKQTLKDEPLDKAVMNPQAQQHMQMDASKAAPAAPPAASGQLTHPTQMGRANTHVAALAGEFQPKGPVTSGLELAPKGLATPPPAIRQSGVPAPHMATMPKPMGMPTAQAAMPKPGMGSIFGKSEKCVLCNKSEHVGVCK